MSQTIQHMRSDVAGDVVSIVIPCLNEEGQIGLCLDSILNSDYPRELLEVMVVDGMSIDATREIVRAYSTRHPFIRLVDNPRRTQPAAVNIGVAQATGTFVIRVDTHASFRRDAISRYVHYMKTTDADAVGCRLITVPRNPTLVGLAIATVMSERFGVGNSQFRVAREDDEGEPRWVDAVAYPCFRQNLFARFGPLDERLARSEDAEFYRRIRAKGAKLLFVPTIVDYYHSRSEFRAYWQHCVSNGLWALLPLRLAGRMVVGWTHMTPMLFVLAILLLAVLSPVHAVFRIGLIALLGTYAVAAISASVLAGWRRRNLRLALVLPLFFGMLHIGYGIGSVRAAIQVLSSWLSRQPADSPSETGC